MATPVYFSPRVIDTVSSLPVADRLAIGNALSMEYILGMDPSDTLTPMQNILYSMIKFYIDQDASRMETEPVASSASFRPGRCAFG